MDFCGAKRIRTTSYHPLDAAYYHRLAVAVSLDESRQGECQTCWKYLIVYRCRERLCCVSSEMSLPHSTAMWPHILFFMCKGWWKYDERSNSELEAAFNSGETACKLLLAGALYCIDFQNMVQVHSRNHTKRRHVKRDTPTLPAKGIAGIKITSPSKEQVKADHDRSPSNIEQSDTDVTQIMHDANSHNADEGPEITTNQQHHLEQLVRTISSMELQDEEENVSTVQNT
ncbi:uncharacterized protein LOC113227988 isoform X2 [Hyposmocoma kahamanoa]|uniref:uncharacterized protein LOC113227988 isoform X2 n=1 Tax=Hyposmocoma kahamanoa TaxID=1477025 RepID=UPI000E6D5F1B|nr:uncharacterized protein LOC113227988 isoform X2 [Hyposmocoma kahamanoa]